MPPQMPVHQEAPHSSDDQPLDLSMPSHSLQDIMAESSPPSQGGVKRLRMKEPVGRAAGHGGVCVVKGCGCQNALSLHHPHHTARMHRHSPYPSPQHYSPPHGHRSPGMSEGYSHYPMHQYQAVTSSQPLLPRGASPYYSPESHDLRSRSPYGPVVIGSSSVSLSPYGGGEMGARPHSHSPSNASLLCLPPHSTPTTLSVSPRPSTRDLTPLMPVAASQICPRSRDVSPRLLYRPYEAASASPVSSSNSSGSAVRHDQARTTSDAEIASSSLLLLSNSASAYGTVSGQPSSYWEDRDREMARYGRREEAPTHHYPMDEDRDECERRAPNKTTNNTHCPPNAFHHMPHMGNAHPLPPPHHASPAPLHPAYSMPTPHEYSDRSAASGGVVKSSDADSTHESSNTKVWSHRDSSRPSPPPAQQQHQQAPSHPDLVTSSSKPSRNSEEGRPVRKPIITVTGSTSLAQLRAETEKEREAVKIRKAKTLQEEAMTLSRSADADRENAIDSSSGGDSNSNDSLDCIDGTIKPPDPNLRMCPLDYWISRVLVTNRDAPFKPCNMEVRRKLLNKEDNITFLDLIELKVEQRLKA